MPDNLTTAEENRLLDTSLAGATVALFSVAPDDNGAGGVEFNGNGYARRPLGAAAAANGSTSNAAEILFAVATGVQGTVVAYGIMGGDGTMRWHRTLMAEEQRNINAGDQYRIPAGELTFSLS